MSDLRVTTAALATVAGELDSVAAGLRGGLGSLDGEVSALLGPGWSGEAASAYDGVWREWHEGAQRVVEGLMAMSALLQDAAARYEATDASGAARVTEAGL
ncbi:WXG100 family type VII secretion target [Mycolicibacterium sp. 050158]|uniref:WXG100 family type VII secretion target n=1 Tax=Mycolicibacterium sp. 050158 TaxID=3090602 RepID=UPI00299F1D01|nr:WXG100 family type VII secretion target [Mycolicibacterium sp. 050158]MDX1888599.1 WXG100 family type VII secretion target [Mycolicibacterium sp. 050158]